MRKFEIEIVNYLEKEGSVAEIYYESFHWAEIYKEKEVYRDKTIYTARDGSDLDASKEVLLMAQGRTRRYKGPRNYGRVSTRDL